MINLRSLSSIILLFLSITSFGKVVLPAVLSDNMVLQQKSKVHLWGKANIKSRVEIKLSWNNKIHETTSDLKGKWSIIIDTPNAGGPFTISFNDGEKTILNNILIGDVWLCSGQSNMEMPVKGFICQPVIGSTQTIVNAKKETPIRLFTVKKNISVKPEESISGTWLEHNPKNVKEFSACAYYFGLQLYKTLGIPIGLINTSYGASNIESWMSEESLKIYPEISLKHLSSDVTTVKNPQKCPTLLYNAMLYPLKNVCLKGVIWYQGEANRNNSDLYKKLLVTFVEHLRYLFNNHDMPFYYAQIAPYSYGNSNNIEAAKLREAQSICETKIRNSGMAVLMDIGEENCIHPSHKKEVGERLALLALHNCYNIEGIHANSPKFISKKIEDNKIILQFKSAELGLTSFGKQLNNFQIAGKDSVFYHAEAKILKNKVEVWSKMVKKPIAVRYGFFNYVKGDLFGTDGLPVSSFRTDF